MSTQRSVSTLLRFNVFKSEQLDYQFIRTLAFASHDGAAIGECLYAASQINERSMSSWVKAWSELAARVEEIARQDLERGHPVSARKAFLRACNYYRTAEFFASIRMGEAAPLYRKSVACFDSAGALFDPPFEAIRIPYEGKVLPGHFFRVDNVNSRRPTLVICGGGDGSGEELYFWVGREAMERGYNLLVFHGPGHRGALHRDASLVFRHDYETPLKAAIDYAVSRPDVDAERLALMGVSLGGYLTPRAAAFDKRIKALIADSPITDYHRVLISLVETAVGRIPTFAENVLVRMASRFLPESVLEYQMWAYGVKSLSEYLEVNKAFRLDDLPKQITCPTLCLQSAGEDEEIQNQAREFYDALQCAKHFRFFTPADGADTHCQLNNLALSYQVVFDWLDEIFMENR